MATHAETSAPMRVFTQNIRRSDPAVPAGDPDDWNARQYALADVLRTVDADLIGTQEVLFEQIPVLDAVLASTHERIGFGREGGSQGEHNLLYVRRERFTIHGWEQLWLSADPLRIGSEGWDAHCPRIVVAARVHDQVTNRDVLVAVTHFDHAGEQARIESARLLADQLTQRADGSCVILMGDFNVPSTTSKPWQIFAEAGFTDAHDAAEVVQQPDIGTFPDYEQPVAGGERIDWVLTRGVTVREYSALAHCANGAWASDHAGVLAVLDDASNQA